MFSQFDTKLRLASTLAAFMTFAPGCGDDGSDSGNDTDAADSNDNGGGSSPSGGSGAAPADCATRCADKVAECQAPPDVAAAQCQAVCGSGLSESELDCIEGSSCEELAESVESGVLPCGIGDGGGETTGGGGGETSGNGSGNGSGANASIGDACSCPSSSDDYASCSGTDGPCGELTCFVFGGEGICSVPCMPDGNGGDDCPSGTCTDHLINVDVSVGMWCE
jgi:hypothetical protein